MVREVSYREFQKHHNIDPEPPAISYKAYKAGSFIKCPLLCSPGISSWHDVSGGSTTGAIWDMMIKVTVFKLVETGGVK